MSFNQTNNIGSRRAPEKTRVAILGAALEQFAQEGLAGARMDAIARLARVNKALLHYYFRDKETLYGAALEHVFTTLAARMMEVLNRDLPPKEKIMAYAAAHFDFIAASPIYPRLVQREMMRAGKHGSPQMRRMASHLRPVQEKLVAVMRAGMAEGEFRKVHPLHFILSVVAMNIFYFSCASFLQILTGENPYTRQRLAERKAAVLDMVAAALLKPDPQNVSRKSNAKRSK